MDIAVHAEGGKGRRNCPALHGWITTRDCGKHRLKEIRCPADCKYLDQHERYHHAKVAEEFHQAWVQVVMPYYQSQDVKAIDFLIATEISLYQFLKTNPTSSDQDALDGLKFFHRQLSPVQVVESAGNALGKHLAQHAVTYQQKQPDFNTEKSQAVVDLLIQLMDERQGEDVRQSINGLLGHMEAHFDLSSVEPMIESDEESSSAHKIITPGSTD